MSNKVVYDWFHDEELCAVFELDEITGNVSITIMTDKTWLLPYGERKHITKGSLDSLILSRLPAEDSININDVLEVYGLKEYNIDELLRVTKGKSPVDEFMLVKRC